MHSALVFYAWGPSFLCWISIFFSLRPSGVYLAVGLVAETKTGNHSYRQTQLGKGQSYLRSFSIRSTWVMTMRRQQYRLSPRRSMASLGVAVSTSWATSTRTSHVPFLHALVLDHPQVALPEITRDLVHQLATACRVPPTQIPRTFPQEKHRTGIIILSGERARPVSRRCVVEQGACRRATLKERSLRWRKCCGL